MSKLRSSISAAADPNKRLSADELKQWRQLVISGCDAPHHVKMQLAEETAKEQVRRAEPSAD